MAYPTMETSVPTLSTTQVEGPYVEFFLDLCFSLGVEVEKEKDIEAKNKEVRKK